jgi:hypothetical protein
LFNGLEVGENAVLVEAQAKVRRMLNTGDWLGCAGDDPYRRLRLWCKWEFDYDRWAICCRVGAEAEDPSFDQVEFSEVWEEGLAWLALGAREQRVSTPT